MVFAWCFVLASILLFSSSSRLYLSSLVVGFVFHLLSLYWFSEMLCAFGGLCFPLNFLITVGFALFYSLQFLLCAWLFRLLSKTFLSEYRLALPLAWFCAEFFYPKFFPWTLSRTQLLFSPLSALGEFLDAHILGFLMFYWGELALLCAFFLFRRVSPAALFRLVPSALFLPLLLLGLYRTRFYEAIIAAEDGQMEVALVQGNLDIHRKGDISYLSANLAHYRELSKDALRGGAVDLLVWPESVSLKWMPEGLASLRNTALHPFPSLSTNMIYGGLSYRRASELPLRFNSAFAIDAEARVLGVYHKRALVPFGEYVPLSEYFPALKGLFPQIANLSFGDLKEPITMRFAPPVGDASVGVLICYDDIVPELSFDAVRAGAELLVNLTNDAWYGDTAAPYQHHMLASWRAIETRRYLLRSTNTGYTAVVDPLGRTFASLPIFEPGVLRAGVKLMSSNTLHSSLGNWPSWLLFCSVMLGLALRFSSCLLRS